MGQDNTPLQLVGYSYEDIKGNFNGLELVGVTDFDFKIKKNKFNNFGFGSYAVSRTSGKREPEGSITIDYATQKMLVQRFAPVTGLLSDIPPGLLILSLTAPDGTKEIITLTAFEFMDDGISGSSGDENITADTDCIFAVLTRETF